MATLKSEGHRGLYLKVFLSYSFDDADAEVANHFVDLFCAIVPNAEIITAKQPKAIPIAKKVDNAIDKCDCLLAILTKKHQLTSKQWLPPPWCLSEIGKAQGRGIPYFGFYEKEFVDIKKLGSAIEIELFPFLRKKLPVKEVDAYLRSQIKNRGLLTLGSYEFEVYSNNLVIYKNGHGIVSNKITVRTFKELEAIRHVIGLGTCAGKGVEFKGGLKTLIQTPITERFQKQHLFAHLNEADPVVKGLKLSIKSCPGEQGTPQRIPFLVSFNKPVPLNTKIVYSFGWSTPLMHYTRDVDRKRANKPYPISSLTARHPIRKIIKTISFERGVELQRIPRMTILDVNESVIDEKEFDCCEDIYYTRYELSIDPVLSNAEYRAMWRFK